MKTAKLANFPGYIIYGDGRVYSERWQRFLKPAVNPRYLKVALRDINNEQKLYFVHRIVAQAFLSNPLNLATVNHKDGNKLNNNLSNLEWASHRDNLLHAKDLGLLRSAGRAGSLVPGQVRAIRYLYEMGYTMERTGRMVGANRWTVKDVLRFKTYGGVAR